MSITAAQVGKTVTVQFRDRSTVTGRVAIVDARYAWLRLERITGYWPHLPVDGLYPVGVCMRYTEEP